MRRGERRRRRVAAADGGGSRLEVRRRGARQKHISAALTSVIFANQRRVLNLKTECGGVYVFLQAIPCSFSQQECTIYCSEALCHSSQCPCWTADVHCSTSAT